MINAIITASLRDRFMVLIATVIIALTGFFSYINAPLDAIPDLSDVPGGRGSGDLPVDDIHAGRA
jgi:Cu(I)/Ag(I) efflux system membrane protein CusA/SilA